MAHLNEDQWDDFDEDRELALSVIALSILPDPGRLTFDSKALTWRIDNWGTIGSSTRSPGFRCGGTDWRLLLYPSGNPAVNPSTSRDFVSLYVDRSNWGTTTPTTSVCVQFSLVVSNPHDSTNHVCYHTSKRMGPGEVEWGFPRFCQVNVLRTPRFDFRNAILQGSQLDVTVMLRVMDDPAGNLWRSGAPAPSMTSPQARLSAPHRSIPHMASHTIPTYATASSSSPRVVRSKPKIETRPAKLNEACTVCYDEPTDFPLKAPTASCSHPSQLCIDCMRETMKSEIMGKCAVLGIRCPTNGCEELLGYHDIQLWSDVETFSKYDDFLVKKAMGVEGNYVNCKNAACDAGQIHDEGAEAPIVTCYACRFRSCFNHQIPWHEGYTCAEWDEYKKGRNEESVKSTKEYLARFTKTCPNCKRPTEKASGCDHMKCSLCLQQYCWECLAPYEAILRDGNHHHKQTCKHYAAFGAAPPALQRKRLWYAPWRHRYT